MQRSGPQGGGGGGAVEAVRNLSRIDHIVVLMLENRSFDHMLDYLSLPPAKGGRGRRDVNGLKGNEVNVIRGYSGGAGSGKSVVTTPSGKKIGMGEVRYPVFPLRDTVFPLGPGHAIGSVDVQLGARGDPPMGGFVRSFIEKQKAEGVDLPDGLIMGYYTAKELPTYDLLAQNFAVCDRWFSSMPGPTWPNRMFFYAGTSNNIVKNSGLSLTHPKYIPEYKDMPERIIVHVLDEHDVDWRIYSHGFAWMRFFKKFDPGPFSRLGRIDRFARFLDACAGGRLPAVSFIDPEWSEIGPETNASDDLAPTDVRGAQRLVARIYEALRTGANALFDRTLFVVTYDEHGGFYDHVPPPSAPEMPEREKKVLKRYGVRVPALVVSPLVAKGAVSHTLFDHTSMLKTILLRFCMRGGGIPFMSAGVNIANNLGELLTERVPRTDLPSAASVLEELDRGLANRGRTVPVQTEPEELALAIAAGRAQALAAGVPEEHL
jgi:phospholipase C